MVALPEYSKINNNSGLKIIMNNKILSVENLTKKFSGKKFWFKTLEPEFVAVNNITFDMQEGEILGFLGPNGAGKTTTISMLLGVMSPTSGRIKYFDKDLSKDRSNIMQHVSFASTYVRLPGRLTIYENLDVYARLYSMKRSDRIERIEKYLKFFDLWSIKNRDTGTLSAGQTTRVMVVKAFLSNPKVVLLDEPTASLDPDVAHMVREFIKTQREQNGTSILLTSHNMDEVTESCDRVLVLKKGSIIANNTPEQLALSVTDSRIQLMITENFELAQNLCKSKNLKYIVEDKFLKVELEEKSIANFLSELAKLNVNYIEISIEKPTLEDYFLHIAKSE